jgi:hypothetical protein
VTRLAPPALVALAAALPLAGGVPAQAATKLATLPNATVLLQGEPPLRSQAAIVRETRLPRRISSSERVEAGLDLQGTVRTVRVLQRLTLRGLGDYTFAVPAPVLDVEAGPGSRSDPGRRPNEIIWMGFSPGRRVLSALADLRADASAPALPLAVHVQTSAGGRPVTQDERIDGPLRVGLVVRNTTARTVAVFSAAASPQDAAAALDGLRSAVRAQAAVADRTVRVSGEVRARAARVSAAVRVTGELRFPAGSVDDLRASGGNAVVAGPVVRFSGLLGGERPPTLHLVVRGVGSGAPPPRVRIVAASVPPDVTPPGGRSWAAALASGRIPADGRALLRRAIDLGLAYELGRRYDTFLANPDPGGPSRASYVFTSGPVRAEPVAPAASSHRGVGPLALAGIVLALLLTAATAVVAWAHL